MPVDWLTLCCCNGVPAADGGGGEAGAPTSAGGAQRAEAGAEGIGTARTQTVGKYPSCMVSKLRKRAQKAKLQAAAAFAGDDGGGDDTGN